MYQNKDGYYRKKDREYEEMMNEMEAHKEKLARFDELEKNVRDLKQLVHSFEISMEDSKRRGN